MDEDASAQVEVWSTSTNGSLVRMPGRRYPGVVIQGDSLSVLFDRAMWLVERAAETRDMEGLGVAVELAEQLHAQAEHYEAVLAARGVDLPYVRRPRRSPRQFLYAIGPADDANDKSIAVSAVSLIVLRCSNVAEAKRFYEAIGLVFRAEKHGAGAEHWSCHVGDTVLELYPTVGAAAKPGRLGLRVADVREALRRLAISAGRVDKPFDESTGIAVVVDPDGTKLELSQPARDAPAPPRARWAVWRQDDNGNRFLINGGLTREEADRLCGEFEAKGHKQLYWVAPEGRDAG